MNVKVGCNLHPNIRHILMPRLALKGSLQLNRIFLFQLIESEILLNKIEVTKGVKLGTEGSVTWFTGNPDFFILPVISTFPF